MMELALLCLLGFLALAQLLNWGLALWRHYGTKLLLVNYTVTGPDNLYMHCSNFGWVRGPVTDVALDNLVNQFVAHLREDHPQIEGYSLNSVLRLDGAAPLPREPTP